MPQARVVRILELPMGACRRASPTRQLVAVVVAAAALVACGRTPTARPGGVVDAAVQRGAAPAESDKASEASEAAEAPPAAHVPVEARLFPARTPRPRRPTELADTACGWLEVADWQATLSALRLDTAAPAVAALAQALRTWTGLPLLDPDGLRAAGVRPNAPVRLTWRCGAVFALAPTVADPARLRGAVPKAPRRALVFEAGRPPAIVFTTGPHTLQRARREAARAARGAVALGPAIGGLRTAGDLTLAFGLAQALPHASARKAGHRFAAAAVAVHLRPDNLRTEVFLADRATETAWPAAGPAVTRLADALGSLTILVRRTTHPDAKRIAEAKDVAVRARFDPLSWSAGPRGLLGLLGRQGGPYLGAFYLGGQSKAVRRLADQLAAARKRLGEAERARDEAEARASRRLREVLGPWYGFGRDAKGGITLYGVQLPEEATVGRVAHVAIARWYAGSAVSPASQAVATAQARVDKLRKRHRAAAQRAFERGARAMQGKGVFGGAGGVGFGASLGTRGGLGGAGGLGGGGMGAIGGGGRVGGLGHRRAQQPKVQRGGVGQVDGMARRPQKVR